MQYTLTEKIFARCSKKDHVKAGDMVEVEPDLLVMYDWEGISDYVFNLVEKEIGRKIDGGKMILFTDHKMPPGSVREQAFHLESIRWAKEHNAKLIPKAIGHQLLTEMGLVDPGNLAVHFDRHINLIGAVGALGIGSRLELICSLSTGTFSIQVPDTVQISLSGNLSPGVMGRDLFNCILRDLGPDGTFNHVVEYSGPGALNVSMDSRSTICCLAMFTGATAAIFVPDDVTKEFYSTNFHKNINIENLNSDPNSKFISALKYDLASIEPFIIKPPKPQDVHPIKEFYNQKIDQGFIGSCASGRLEDFEIASRILKGRKIANNFRLYIVPSSSKIMAEASQKGYLNILLEAGAWIGSPTCDFCYGKTQVLANNEIAISTATLNVPGRMGNVNSEIYIGSSATVASTAIEGKIADPRNFL
jgi:3-isopropylmalate/(R)-2-methylmalate dehydratase large subunit